MEKQLKLLLAQAEHCHFRQVVLNESVVVKLVLLRCGLHQSHGMLNAPQKTELP